MSDHPTTFRADPDPHGAGFWEDRAALHRADNAGGLLDAATALRRGSFAELVAYVMLLPEEERQDYVIEKLGDREYRADEIADLAARADYPPA